MMGTLVRCCLPPLSPYKEKTGENSAQHQQTNAHKQSRSLILKQEMEHPLLPLPAINSYESSRHVLKWPDARIDSVGSNDMQQSDMNHPPSRHAVEQQHSQKASDTIYGKRKTRRSHWSTDGPR